MFGECHAHVIMDGKNYKAAVELHREHVCDEVIHSHLAAWKEAGVSFVRDGGDALGVSKRAKALASEYGIDYRTPIFAIHKKGHYGGIVGHAFEDWKEYARLIARVREEGGTFIKIMISGIMDFGCFGKMSEQGLSKEEIRTMIGMAHDAGFAVMVHANGSAPVSAAIEAGADSIEHGNYLEYEVLAQLAESETVWIPTLAPIGNLLGCGRFPDEAVTAILENQKRRVEEAFGLGAKIGLGSDSGAYLVPHGTGLYEEYEYMKQAVGDETLLRKRLAETEERVKRLF